MMNTYNKLLLLFILFKTKFRFTTADKVAGGRGFRAVWTEIKIPVLVGGYDCDEVGGQYFRCANSTFCIAKQLEWDGNPNCGLNDISDEGLHCMSHILYFFPNFFLVIYYICIYIVFIRFDRPLFPTFFKI